MAEVRTLETEVAQYIDLTCKYLISRGELIKKVVKYPHVEDFRRSVQSLDEKQFVSLRFVALELRNHYVSKKKAVRISSTNFYFIVDKCSRSSDEKSRENQKASF